MENKGIVVAMILMFGMSIYSSDTQDASASNFWNSPGNYENSANNYENSTQNWKNSPNNYENSIHNRDRKSIFDESGNSIGYVVPKSNGGSNIFTNEGKRIGYEAPDND